LARKRSNKYSKCLSKYPKHCLHFQTSPRSPCAMPGAFNYARPVSPTRSLHALSYLRLSAASPYREFAHGALQADTALAQSFRKFFGTLSLRLTHDPPREPEVTPPPRRDLILETSGVEMASQDFCLGGDDEHLKEKHETSIRTDCSSAENKHIID